MTDMVFAPIMINAVLVMLIVSDLILGRWNIFTSIELMGLITWNSFLLYMTYGPQKPPLTITETINKYPELWGWYFEGDWVGFWELTESQTTNQKET